MGAFTGVYKCLKAGCTQDGVKLFTMVTAVRTQSSGHQLEPKRHLSEQEEMLLYSPGGRTLKQAIQRILQSLSSSSVFQHPSGRGCGQPAAASCAWGGLGPAGISQPLPTSASLWPCEVKGEESPEVVKLFSKMSHKHQALASLLRQSKEK